MSGALTFLFVFVDVGAGLLPEQISCDGWSIGYDARFDKKLRLQQCLLFARFDEHSNLYAHPRECVASLII